MIHLFCQDAHGKTQAITPWGRRVGTTNKKTNGVLYLFLFLCLVVFVFCCLCIFNKICPFQKLTGYLLLLCVRALNHCLYQPKTARWTPQRPRRHVKPRIASDTQMAAAACRYGNRAPRGKKPIMTWTTCRYAIGNRAVGHCHVCTSKLTCNREPRRRTPQCR